MLKSVYDTNNNGIVDNAEKVNNHTVLTDVPANALFTDTIYDDTNIVNSLNNKVDKITGKGLSTNDFTTTLKDKLDGIESGAQVNTITGIKGNSETTYRTGNVNITKDNIGLGNVENKSSATIRGELTSANITDALGYTPASSTSDTTYTLTQDASNGHKITLTSSAGTSNTITIPDNDTKFTGGAITSAITRTLASSGTISTTNLFTVSGSTDGFKVDYAATTSDLGITTLYTTDDATAKISIGNTISGTYKEAISVVNGSASISGSCTTANNAISTITRSGTTFTATRVNGGTFTFTQQDNNTTYSAGTGLSLSSTTFNLARTNLYNNTSGTTGTITLSQTAANFNYIVIYFRNINNEGYGSMSVYAPNGKVVGMQNIEANGVLYCKLASFKFNGTSLSFTKNCEQYNDGSNHYSTGNYIYVVRVDGYK